MKKIYSFLAQHLKKIYWSIVLWLVILVGTFSIAVSAALIPERVVLFLGIFALFAIPALTLNILGTISLIQAVKRQRGILSALGYTVGGLIGDVFCVLFFFFALFSIFGFS